MPSRFWTRRLVDSGKRWTRTSAHQNPLTVQTSTSPEPSLKKGFKESDVIPAIEDAQGDSGSEESPASISTPVSERALACVTTRKEDTKTKLGDSFVPTKNKVTPLLKSTPNTSDLRPVGFSLLNELNLDLELEDEDPFPTGPLP